MEDSNSEDENNRELYIDENRRDKFDFLKEVNHNSPWLTAYRWLAEPYEEPLETNERNNDGLTPFDIYVRIWNLNVLEKHEIGRFRKLIVRTLKLFPPTSLYPEMVRMLIDLDIKFDPKLFYTNSNLELFPPFIKFIINYYAVIRLPVIEDIQRIIIEYL